MNTSLSNLKVISYNCRSIKSSIDEVRNLCSFNDIVFLQETWLCPDEIDLLQSIHKDFISVGTSAMTEALQSGILLGRPYGGIGILWNKSITSMYNVTPKYFKDPRLLGLEISDKNHCKMLLLNTYLPYNDPNNFDSYCNYLAKIDAICDSYDSVYTITLGDFNAGPLSNFGKELISFADENNYVLSDIVHFGASSNCYTYISESHNSRSWLDHCLASKNAHQLINNIEVHHNLTAYDHFPLSIHISLDKLSINMSAPPVDKVKKKVPSWTAAKDCHLENYCNLTDKLLSEIHIPDNLENVEQLSDFYCSIVHSLSTAASSTLPKCKQGNIRQIPGWNEVVKEAHEAARDAFVLWHSNDKPRYGPIFDLMRKTRARFKYSLRQCKREESAHRANAFAKNLCDKDYKSFWRGASLKNSSTSLPTVVAGISGQSQIADVWKKHYSDLFNSVQSTPYKEYVLSTVSNSTPCADSCIYPSEITAAIKSLKCSKSAGPDGLVAEHFKHASAKLSVLLSVCFSAMFKSGFIPQSLMLTTLSPILKSKMGDVSDVGNYRPIAVSSMMSKIVERIILSRIKDYLDTSDNQFGFKKGHSTDMAIFALKQVISYYSNHSSPLFVCFLDASKAFDRVNHWVLFKKLIDSHVPIYIVRFLIFWYREQKLNIRWGSEFSESFSVSNGVKQGGILSPLLFNCYMDGLSTLLSNCKSGCFIHNIAMNHFMYADDICLVAPSPKGLQNMLNICEEYAHSHDIIYNERKSVSMLIQSKKVKFVKMPNLLLNGQSLKFVDSYRYLGCVISNTLSDNLDVDRQRRVLYASANKLKRRFWNCDYDIKKLLFSSYCASLYCSHLWVSCRKVTYDSVRIAYNNSCRILFDYDRFCSASSMFVENNLLNFDCLIRKYIYNFQCRLAVSKNNIVRCLQYHSLLYSTPLGEHWIELLYSRQQH